MEEMSKQLRNFKEDEIKMNNYTQNQKETDDVTCRCNEGGGLGELDTHKAY